ncbi:MAG: cyclic nucleotide-binding domain-containing protein [Terracidiphilus sp.]
MPTQELGDPQLKLDASTFVADPDLIQALKKSSVPVFCAESRVLFLQGDPSVGLYILDSGVVTLTMNSENAVPIVSVRVAPASLLGLPALVGNQPYTLTAIAQSGARLSFITREDFNALMQNDPLMALKVLQVLAAEVRSARNAILQR